MAARPDRSRSPPRPPLTGGGTGSSSRFDRNLSDRARRQGRDPARGGASSYQGSSRGGYQGGNGGSSNWPGCEPRVSYSGSGNGFGGQSRGGYSGSSSSSQRGHEDRGSRGDMPPPSGYGQRGPPSSGGSSHGQRPPERPSRSDVPPARAADGGFGGGFGGSRSDYRSDGRDRGSSFGSLGGSDGSVGRGGPPSRDSSMNRAGPPSRDSSMNRGGPPSRDSSMNRGGPPSRDSSMNRGGPPSRDSSMNRGGPPSRDSSMDRGGPPSRDSSMDRVGQERRSSWGGRGGQFDRGPRGRGGGHGGGGGGGRGFGSPFVNEPPKDICDDAAPKKPGQRGTLGKSLLLKTNFVKMRMADQGLQIYHVDFDPPVESRRKKTYLIMSLKDVHKGQFIPDALLISKVNFVDPAKGDLELTAHMKVRGENGPEEAPVKVRFRKTLDVTWDKSTEFIHMVNNIAKTGLRKLHLTQMKHSFYDMASKIAIDGFHGMARVPSWEIPVSYRHGGLMMGILIKERMIRTDTVLDQLKKLRTEYRGDYRSHANASLVGEVVQLKYSGRTFKIGEILWDVNVNSPYRADSAETVLEYYEKHFPDEPEARITDLGQPLLMAEPTARDRRRENMEKRGGENKNAAPKKIHLVPELCRMTGLVDELKKEGNMRELAKRLRKDPEQRVSDAQRFLRRYGADSVKRLLSDYSLELENEPVTVEARQLSNISLSIKGRKLAIQRATFNHCLKNQEAERHGKIREWAVVVADQNSHDYRNWQSQVMQILTALVPNVPEPSVYICPGVHSGHFVRKISEIVDRRWDLVLIVVPDGDEARYSAIKKLLNCTHGIPCQVVQLQKVRKRDMSITTKICAQMVAKTGGALWACPTTKSGTMIIGFDLYKPKATKGRSVSAMVASLDPNMTLYTSVSFLQAGDQFVSQNFAEAFRRCFNVYKKRNGAPKRILVYRGGVSYGEMDTLKAMEIGPIHEHLKKSNCNSTEVGYIVVNKRANVHFFHQQGSRHVNPPDGVVIDTTITNKEANDFYLIPQSTNQGCVNPVYYRILEDGINDFSMDYYQLLTFKLTHTYFNWTGAIKVPGVLQYATKLGTLVGTYTSEPLNELLSVGLPFL